MNFRLLSLILLCACGYFAEAQRSGLSPEQALQFYYAGDLPAATRTWQSILEADGRSPEERRQAREALGALYQERGQYHRALDLLPDDDIERVRVLFLSGDYVGALALYTAGESDITMSDASRTALFAARAAYEVGDTARSRRILDRVFAASPVPAGAYELLGRIELRREHYSEAIEALRMARRLEPNLTATLLPEARALRALERHSEARSVLLQATRVRPHDRDAAELLQTVNTEFPRFDQLEEADRMARREAGDAPVVAARPAGIADIPTVRVGIAENIQEVWVKTGGQWRLGNSPQTGGERGEILRFAADSDNLVVERNGQALHRSSMDNHSGPHTEWWRLEYESPDSTSVVFDLEYSTGQFSAGIEDRAYRGSLLFGRAGGSASRDNSGFTLVNRVDVESYLYSVVPSEMPAYWPDQALRAQAIAARSYTLAHLGRFGSRGFDVLGSVRSAFYRGVTGESPRSTEAVDATRGHVLETAGGAALSAVYSANNAGLTDNASDVWGYASALQGVADPQLGDDPWFKAPHDLAEWITSRPDTFSSIAPYSYWNAYRWELWVDTADIAARNSGIDAPRALVPEGRTPAGRVRHVRISGENGSIMVSGDAIRSSLGGLRSNLFVVNPVLDADGAITGFFFRGAGWGHGVGMDQTGAAGMASLGYSFAEILEHYYPQASLLQRY